jgi:hypothetical protein
VEESSKNWKRTALAAAIVIAGFTQLGCEKAALDRQVAELCEKDGGVKVYEAVRLPPEMFDRAGNPFPGWPPEKRPGQDYRYVLEIRYLKQGEPVQLFSEGRLSRETEKVIRVTDGKLLGESISYSRVGGEVILLGHPSSKRCPVYKNANETLLRSVFLKRGEG